MVVGVIEALAFSVALYTFGGLPIGAGLLLYPSAIIVILYLADFLGVLQPTSYAIHTAVFVAACCAARAVYRGGYLAGLLRSHWPRLIVVAACSFALAQAMVLCSLREFHSWDEFSHWGTIIRVLFEANTFHLEPNPLYFQDYPPGFALFSYHILQLTGFSESQAYFSYALLLGCFSAGLIDLASRRSAIGGIVVLIFVWKVVELLGPGWASLLVDHMLAFFFAGIIAAYYLVRHDSRKLFVFPIALAAFSLTKQAAQSFALLACAIIISDQALYQFNRSQKKASWLNGKIWVRAAGLSLLLFGPALLVQKSWHHYVMSSKLNAGWGTYSPTSRLHDFMNCCQSPREVAVSAKFFSALFNAPPHGEHPRSIWELASDTLSSANWNGLQWSISDLATAPGLTMISLTVASLVLTLLASSNADRLRGLSFTTLMTFGGVGYTASLLIAYLYTFSDYEATNLASFSRFFTVYILAWLLALLAFTYSLIEGYSRLFRGGAQLLMGATVCSLVYSGTAIPAPVLTPEGYRAAYVEALSSHRIAGRDEIKKWVAQFSSDLPQDARVYIWWPKTSGLEFWMTKYELSPRLTNLFCFGITRSLEPELAQECTMSDLRLRKTLEDYQFVAIGDHLRTVVAEYPDLFEALPNSGRGLFRVVRDRGVKLVPYGPPE